MTDDELDALHAQACGEDAERVYAAIEQLAKIEEPTAETIELVIDLMTSDLAFEAEFSDAFASVPKYTVAWLAAATVKQFGTRAIDALSVRITSPAKPGDGRLLERSAVIGKPLFDLARILITDGDVERSRAAEPIVARSVAKLEIGEAIGIYLAICDRERYAARAMPGILRKIWPRLGTPEGRAVIAERWTERGLWPWIDDRLDREPMAACTLLALLIAGPAAAEPVIRDLLAPMQDEARWIAIESMLVIDPVRMGEVFAGEPALHEWASGRTLRALRFPARELEIRLAIACAASPNVVEALIASKAFTGKRFLGLLSKIKPRLLREALAGVDVVAPSTRQSITRAIAAIDGPASQDPGDE